MIWKSQLFLTLQKGKKNTTRTQIISEVSNRNLYCWNWKKGKKTLQLFVSLCLVFEATIFFLDAKRFTENARTIKRIKIILYTDIGIATFVVVELKNMSCSKLFSHAFFNEIIFKKYTHSVYEYHFYFSNWTKLDFCFLTYLQKV